MRWFLAAALAFVAVPAAHAQDKDAEKLFRTMEKKVGEAKALAVRFEIALTGGSREIGDLKGRFTLDVGNKVKAVGKGKLDGKPGDFTFICDGTTLYLKSPLEDDGKPRSLPADTKLGKLLLPMVNRAGLFAGMYVAGSPTAVGEVKPEDVRAINFKLGTKEKIDGRDAQRVDYTLRVPGNVDNARVQVWIDVATQLPLRRVIVTPGDDKTAQRITETYGEFTVNPTLEASEFDLPQ